MDQVLARVGELAVSREIAAVKGKLQRMNPVQQQTEYNQLFGDLVALEQRARPCSTAPPACRPGRPGARPVTPARNRR